jgi:hypothetical protein
LTFFLNPHIIEYSMGFFKKASNFILHPTTHSRTMGLLTILLLASVLFVNIIVVQHEQQLSSRAAPLEPSSVAVSGSTPVSVSGDYFPTGVTISQGQLVSGDYNSLSSKDSANLKASSLVIDAKATGRYYYLEYVADFALPSQQINSLNISYSGKYSTWRTQGLYLYNYVTSVWETIESRTIGASIVNFEKAITNPASYVSPSGQVRVKLFVYNSLAFSSYTDYLKLSTK